MHDGGVPPESWESLEGVDLADTFLQRVPMLQSCPHFLRGRLRFCFSLALRERTRARQAGDERAEIRAWKLFGLIPMMLLHKPQGRGSVGRDQLAPLLVPSRKRARLLVRSWRAMFSALRTFACLIACPSYSVFSWLPSPSWSVRGSFGPVLCYGVPADFEGVAPCALVGLGPPAYSVPESGHTI